MRPVYIATNLLRCRYFVVSLRVVAENVVTDERTDTHKPVYTVTLAAHARRMHCKVQTFG